MKEKINNRQIKGITLIALVITIIILVILGGTLMALAIGENGLIERTSKSTKEYAKAKMKEDIEIFISNYIAERENTGITLLEYLKTNNSELLKSKIQYDIDEDGNIIFEKDGFYAIVEPKTTKIDTIEISTRLVKMKLDPKIVEPGDKVTATISAGKDVDLDNCKYEFIKKSNQEITEEMITKDLVDKVATNNDQILNLKTKKIASIENNNENIEIELDTKDKIGTYEFYLLVAYKNKSKKTIRKTEVTIGTPVSKITLDKKEIEIIKTQTQTLKATIEPNDASIKEVYWTTDDSKIAIVNSEGLVTGVSAGTTTINAIAKDGSGVKATCSVQINPLLVSSIKLNKTTLTLHIGETETLSLGEILPKDADNQSITWSSNDTEIATVSSEGEVAGLKKGTAIITATANGGNDVKTTCNVTVKPNGADAEDVKKSPSTYFGKTVNYSANGVSDWKVFYADNDNIFLITSSKIAVSKLDTIITSGSKSGKTIQAATGLIKKSDNEVDWPARPIAQTVPNLGTSFMYSMWTKYSEYGYLAVAALLCCDNWIPFVNSSYADYAIGGPTVEMFCASWNKLYPSKPINVSVDANGYKVNGADSVYYNYYPTGFNNALYSGDYNLSSTTSGTSSGSSIYGIPLGNKNDSGLGGHLWDYNNSYKWRGLRPVVRLKKGVVLTNTNTGGKNYGLSM